MKHNIEFVSYKSEPCCLCTGTLTLKIDGNIVIFDGDKNPKFWETTGECYIDEDGDHIEEGPWKIIEDEDYLREKLKKKYFDILDEMIGVMNEYVSYGCCGGCL